MKAIAFTRPLPIEAPESLVELDLPRPEPRDRSREENHQRRTELSAARKVVMDALCGETGADRFDCASVVAT